MPYPTIVSDDGGGRVKPSESRSETVAPTSVTRPALKGGSEVLRQDEWRVEHISRAQDDTRRTWWAECRLEHDSRAQHDIRRPPRTHPSMPPFNNAGTTTRLHGRPGRARASRGMDGTYAWRRARPRGRVAGEARVRRSVVFRSPRHRRFPGR